MVQGEEDNFSLVDLLVLLDQFIHITDGESILHFLHFLQSLVTFLIENFSNINLIMIGFDFRHWC